MVFWLILANVIVSLIISFFIFAFVGYKISFYSSPKKRRLALQNPKPRQKGNDFLSKLMDEVETYPFEDIYIKSFDKLTLYGRYYHFKDGAPIQICAHGYRGTALRDFAGGLKIAKENGFNAIVIDQRAHGKSQGKTITFGINESKDCLSWVNYAIKRFGNDVNIILSGVSMGGATVLTASGLDLPVNVKGIIADCPFGTPKMIIKKVISSGMNQKADFIFPFIRIGAVIFGHFNLKGGAEESVKNAKIPLLVIHGLADSYVPDYMSEGVERNAASRCTRVTFPNADHGFSYLVDPVRYTNIVKEFIKSLNM